MEIDTEAALSELQGGAETGQDTAAEEIEYYDLPYQDQTIKLPMNHELPLKHNGQVQNVPLEKLFNTYRQSDHIQKKHLDFKTREEEFQQREQKFSDWENLYGQYGEFQKWTLENPDQWERLHEAWQNKESMLSGAVEDNPLAGQLQQLTGTVRELQEKLSGYEQKEQEIQERADVEEVNQDIAKFSEEFPNIDLAETDLDGISLKGQIMKFGVDGNYPTFRAAALDFKYPDGSTLLSKLQDTALRNGRNEAVKAVKQDAKAGVVERSSTPFGQSAQFDTRKLSEDDRDEMALQEMQAAFGNPG